MRRDTYEKIGGFDERFVSPGGGAANIEFFARSTTAPGTQFVVLMSEGSFHQFHGGIATSRHPKELAEHRREWQEEYRKVVGHDWQHPSPTPVFMGGLARPELDYIAWSALMAPPRPAEGRRLRYPQRVRRYMDVLHERELEKGWSLHDAERELTRLRTDVSDMRRELVRLGRVAQSDKKLLAAISRRLDGAQAQADPASTDERLRRYARGLRRRVRAYTNTKGSAERVQRGNGETKTSGIDVRYRRSEAPAHTAEDVAAG